MNYQGVFNMPRYLDPKIDLVFKRIFCDHPNILMSFLNATLPLPRDRQIMQLSYLPSEQIPEIPNFKNTIADVKCTDQQGNIFIVEMQIQWTASFAKRLLYGASRAYTKQLHRGEDYLGLRPVFAVGLIDDIFDDNSNEWYHHYQLTKKNEPQKTIDDVQLLFIELPKFKPETLVEKKLQVLWLRFMSEINENTEEVPQEWLEVPEICEAVNLAQRSAYDAKELEYYEQYWDTVRVQKTYMADAEHKGKVDAQIEIAKNMLAEGLKISVIAKLTQLPVEKIEACR
jgi:predicted transposase/invertase (TIGR01784 family)